MTIEMNSRNAVLTGDLAVPPDVVELVIAARIVVFESKSSEAIKRLDKASEAFADRIPWEDEPGTMIYNLELDIETTIANALASAAFKGTKIVREDLCNCGALKKFLAGHKPWCIFVAAVKANNAKRSNSDVIEFIAKLKKWAAIHDPTHIEELWARDILKAANLIEAKENEIVAYQKELDECQQIAGKALGYPWYKDDQKNFPGATEANGVCIGEHVTSTIVAELARAYEETRIALNEAKEDRSFE